MTENVTDKKEKNCLTMECRDCGWHVIRNDKIDCNHKNRLGMGQQDVTLLLSEDPVIIDKKKELVIE